MTLIDYGLANGYAWEDYGAKPPIGSTALAFCPTSECGKGAPRRCPKDALPCYCCDMCRCKE